MYELLILSMLTSRDMSGYKLGRVLSSTLVPRRDVSNGVMYPLLSKLANAGYIELTEHHEDPRNKKMAHLTEKGAKRFQELMKKEIPDDSKRESMYRFKFRGMSAISHNEQLKILTDYKNDVQSDLNVFQEVKIHLKDKLIRGASNYDSLVWGTKSLDLSIQICQTKLQWVQQRELEINESGNN